MKKTRNHSFPCLAGLLGLLMLLLTLPIKAGAAEPSITPYYNYSAKHLSLGQTLLLSVDPQIALAGSDAVVESISLQWYQSDLADFPVGTAIEGATQADYMVTADKLGACYYYCKITAALSDGTTIASFSGQSAVWIGVNRGNEGFLIYYDGEEQSIPSSATQPTQFSFGMMNAEGKDISFEWYACDASGAADQTKEPIATTHILTLPPEQISYTRYYKCVATAISADGTREYDEIMLVVLPPESSLSTEDAPFWDVPKDSWYHDSVYAAYRMGLIKGKTTELFMPDDNMTVAEALKLAACMYQLENEGQITLAAGDPWYKPYIDYCDSHGIIQYHPGVEEGSGPYFIRANEPITRMEYALLFSRAIPSEKLTAINMIPDNAIPDVPLTEDMYHQAIYKLYRAGIVRGSDDYGTFWPDSQIRRSEVAAILVRMMDPAMRVGVPALSMG